jgi:hypothetical protein
MYGKDVGNLNIYIVEKNLEEKKLFEQISGEQGFIWRRLDMDIVNQNEYRIFIEATVFNLLIFYDFQFFILMKNYFEDWNRVFGRYSNR